MAEGDQLRYGQVKGISVGVPCPVAASEVVKAKSGRFVTMNAGNLEMADDGDTLLAGWIEHPEGTVPSGGEVANFHPAPLNLGVVYRIPVNAGTYVVGMLGKTCDLARSSNIQGAKLDGSGEDVLLIVGGDAVNNRWVDVVYNPSKLTSYTGVV